MILILVVVDNGLVRTEVICTSGKCFVLILIVVDEGFVLWFLLPLVMNCLNPCCSGQRSRTLLPKKLILKAQGVLILVVMDNGLVQS